MNKQIDELFQKRMDRKDFLKHVGVGMIVASGLGAAFKAINPNEAAQKMNGQAQGYSSGVYGGYSRTQNNVAQPKI